MAITINIVDDSGLTSSQGALWIMGHGIPGTGAATTLMALVAGGVFAQAATQISSASSSNDVATITTAVAHNLAAGDSVFVAGVTPAGYNGLFTVTSVPTSTEVTYTLSQTGLSAGKDGTAYGKAAITAAVAIQSGESIGFDKTSGTGTAQITTTTAHGLQIGETIQISGARIAGYDGVLKVTQVPSPATFLFGYSAASAFGNASAGGQIQAVGLQPVQVSDLPKNSGGIPQLTLNDSIAGYSAKLIVFVVPGTETPGSLSFTSDAVTPTDPPTPPFSPSTLAGNFVFDIVEFAYIAGSNSTFDLSAVDGLAIPMTLTATGVPTGHPSSVGVRESIGRAAIAAAFQKFTAADPLGANFSKLLYQGQVTLAPVAISTAAWSQNVVTLTTEAAHGLAVDEWVVIAGVQQSGYDGNFQVQKVLSSTSFQMTNTDSSLTSSTGGTATPLVFAAPPAVAGQYFNIAAPKDWLANQSPSTADNDDLVTFWDDAVNAFFASGNYLSIDIGKTTYNGASDGNQYSLTNGPNTYLFPRPKPTAGSLANASLANALYVWAQANAPGADEGQLQDQIWQALCRGVAQSGVFKTTAPTKGSTTAWNQNANWYRSGTYCPYSKFLHYANVNGGTDPSGATSIFLEAAAYGFGEDENPDGSYNGPLVPSKLDGTVPDGATVTVRIAAWA